MSDRFRFFSSVKPQQVKINPKFSKLTLSRPVIFAKEELKRHEQVLGEQEGERTANMVVDIDEDNQKALTKPRMFLNETTSSRNENDSDLLTDDDTDSIGSSVDGDFIDQILTQAKPVEQRQPIDEGQSVHTADTIDAEPIGMEEVDTVDGQVGQWDIRSQAPRDSRPHAIDTDIGALSQQLNQLDLVRRRDADESKREDVANVSILSINSNSTCTTEEREKSSVENSGDESAVEVIDLLSDSSEGLNVGLPEKQPNPFYNVSSNSDNAHSISVVQKVSDFIENMPSISEISISQTPEVHSSAVLTQKSRRKTQVFACETSDEDDPNDVSREGPIYVSETSVELDETPEGGGDVSHDGQVAESEDHSRNDSKETVDESKGSDASSNQPETEDEPENRNSEDASQTSQEQVDDRNESVESAASPPPSSDMLAVVKATGGAIKVFSSTKRGDNFGQLNIAAQININIQISNMSSSSSDGAADSESYDSQEKSSEPIALPESSPERSRNDDTNGSSRRAYSTSQNDSQNESRGQPDDSPHQPREESAIELSSREDQNQSKINDLRAERETSPVIEPALREEVFKTPKTLRQTLSFVSPGSKVKKFQYVPPKSLTKSSSKKGNGRAQDKENSEPRNEDGSRLDEAEGSFSVDKSIPIDAMHQRLLYQVYGEAWKTPEVIRCYSAVKRRTNPIDDERQSQSVGPSKKHEKEKRVSRGFMNFRRNIASDLESTRIGERNETAINEPIELIQMEEVEESIVTSPFFKRSYATRSRVQTSIMSSASVSPPISETNSSKANNSKANNSKANNSKAKNSKANNSKADSSEVKSNKKSPLKTSEKRKPPANQRYLEVCDSDTESEPTDDEWKASDAESTPSGDETDDDFEPPARNTKRTKAPASKTVPAKTSATRRAPAARGSRTKRSNDKDQIVYLDLTTSEVVKVGQDFQKNVTEEELAEMTQKFLENGLNGSEASKSGKLDDDSAAFKKPKTTKRKLFTAPRYSMLPIDEPEDHEDQSRREKTNEYEATVDLTAPIPDFLLRSNPFLESTRKEVPPQRSPLKIKPVLTDDSAVIDLRTPSKDGSKNRICQAEVKQTPKNRTKEADVHTTPGRTYGFLHSLDACVSKNLCHPDSLIYRSNFGANKEKLTKILYDLFNEKVFENKLKVPVTWNKKLLTTAGRCCNRKRLNERSSSIELSEKVLTSSDRLRCTLIHELCHAATWVFNAESGHGPTWKGWAAKANRIFPELPKLDRCHQYDIEYKYTYKCNLCGAKSNAHTKSKKVENIRCVYCHGSISIFLNKKGKDGSVVPTPVREASGFAKFVKEKYKDFKVAGTTHAEVMKMISSAFASLSVEEKKKY